MSTRKFLIAGILAALGVAAFTDDAEACGRKRKRGGSDCCGAVAVPMSYGCGGCGGCGGVAYGGAGYSSGPVAMPGYAIGAIPNTMDPITAVGVGAGTTVNPNANPGVITTGGVVPVNQNPIITTSGSDYQNPTVMPGGYYYTTPSYTYPGYSNSGTPVNSGGRRGFRIFR